MNIIRLTPIVLLAAATNASATDHSGASPAPHMELKDASETVVCFAYFTDPATAPIASDCPEGTYTEQLFDSGWDQIGERSVVLGDNTPSVARNPTRIERTCEWDAERVAITFSDVSTGDNFNPYCIITCPEGVAIDGEAEATIPRLINTEDAIRDNVSFTKGTGTQSIQIFVESNIAFIFDRPTLDGDTFLLENRTYDIEAAAVCL